jgi:hypothetical protein
MGTDCSSIGPAENNVAWRHKIRENNFIYDLPFENILLPKIVD